MQPFFFTSNVAVKTPVYRSGFCLQTGGFRLFTVEKASRLGGPKEILAYKVGLS